MEFESWNRKNWILLEREREIFVFQFFCGGFWMGYVKYFHAWFGLDFMLFYRYRKEVEFCKLLSFWVGVIKPSWQKFHHLHTEDLGWNHILKTRWKIWLGYFGRDLACIHDLMHWMWYRYDTYLKLITCWSRIQSNVLMHWTEILSI